jgi:hypothetical protein
MFVAFRRKVLEFRLSIIEGENSKFNLHFFKTQDIVASKAPFYFYF